MSPYLCGAVLRRAYAIVERFRSDRNKAEIWEGIAEVYSQMNEKTKAKKALLNLEKLKLPLLVDKANINRVELGVELAKKFIRIDEKKKAEQFLNKALSYTWFIKVSRPFLLFLNFNLYFCILIFNF